MTFGETIKYLRESNKLTKRETAEYVKCSPTYIANIEKRNVIPGDVIIIRLANLFKYDKKRLLFLAKHEATVPEAKDIFKAPGKIYERELINDYFLTIIVLAPENFLAKDVPVIDKSKKMELSRKIWEKIDIKSVSLPDDPPFVLFKEANLRISEYLNNSPMKDEEIISILKKVIDRVEYNIHNEEISLFFKGKSELSSGDNVEPANLGELVNIPLLSWVQAGGMTAHDDKYPYPGCSEEYIATDLRGEHLFALRIKGDSMTPKFLEGDIVIVNPDAQSVNGSYVIVKDIVTHETTVKQLKTYSNNLSVLHPLNPAYPDIELNENHQIIGRVVRKQTNL